ncbi:MAG: cobalamin-dependent protein [Rhodoferax sp.]|nr:cobalamin-dependent protein [Rhodoferax sp.]
MSTFADALQPWREPCATHVTHAIYARHGEVLERFGPAGRQHCRLDILRHLDYLAVAVEVNDSTPFVQYVLWLQDVLGGRGVPLAHLVFSLELIAGFLTENLPDEAGARLQSVVDAGTACLAAPQAKALARYGLTRLPALPQTSRYQQSILQGNRSQAQASVIEAMDAGATLPQACVQIIQPALYEVGNLWQRNRITVAQEHLASAISQNVLVGAYLKASFLEPNGQSAVFACVEGNHHGLGLRMLSDAFETRGWDAAYLGTDVPTKDLLQDIDSRRPQLLALSASLPQHLSSVRQTVEALRAELGRACPTIWVGGLATLSAPGLWRYTQADGWSSDALHALEQL